MSPYDSEQDTRDHIERVAGLLAIVEQSLRHRGVVHDLSKLGDVEKPIFDRVTPKLKTLTYGSDEYKASLEEMGDALQHHYANNSHHPEHYPNGVGDMCLLDLIEMLCDWKAATECTAGGNLAKSLTINKERFGISDQLANVLGNTARKMGWL